MLNIEMSERIKKLRTINHFNFVGPFFNDKQKDADFSIGSVIREIITRYDYEIKHNYTFVIKYDKDIYSFLAYRMIYSAGSVLQRTIDIKILGDVNTPEEKEIFKNVPVIGYRKARKLKKVVFVTGYHPIYNVIDLSSYSKTFIEIFNPIERFLPDSLTIAQEFYLKPESQLWSLFLETREDNYLDSDWENVIDKTVPIVVFKLEGNENDFPVFNFILKSSKEGNIHMYVVENKEAEKFITDNLRIYVDTRNVPSELNIINNEEYIDMVSKFALNSKNEIINEIHFFDKNTLPKEEDEDENSDC